MPSASQPGSVQRARGPASALEEGCRGRAASSRPLPLPGAGSVPAAAAVRAALRLRLGGGRSPPRPPVGGTGTRLPPPPPPPLPHLLRAPQERSRATRISAPHRPATAARDAPWGCSGAVSGRRGAARGPRAAPGVAAGGAAGPGSDAGSEVLTLGDTGGPRARRRPLCWASPRPGSGAQGLGVLLALRPPPSGDGAEKFRAIPSSTPGPMLRAGSILSAAAFPAFP